MDIIAAHQQGLIEQLDAEVEALAGNPRDHVQRSIVLHHLYEHSGGTHVWALAEARRSLRMAAGVVSLEKRLSRWQWMVRDPDGARAALEELARALGEVARARTIAAYRAYRLSATKALRGEAEASLPQSLLQALDECHSARRAVSAISDETQAVMAEESERHASASTNCARLDAAWVAMEASGVGRSGRRLLGDRALARARSRDERKGWASVEQQLRDDPSLPAAFRINPAQHFYAIQNTLSERRRQQWRELCDLEPDAVALAA
jgi:hypothetical protein